MMKMIEVVNLNTCPDWGKAGDVYIGRGSQWGNPFRMVNQSDIERYRVISLYRGWITVRDVERLAYLKPIRLGCFCKPKMCHGDVLVEMLQCLT